ncbi:MAG: hypothetical protein CMF63_03130 [Magnetovibrio sp.]|nr:hypothetical protein [Magnetovibrio sp.]
MPHAIIRGKNGQRHEVDFEDDPIRVEVHANERVIEISIDALDDHASSDKRRFALLNLPRHLFSEAMGEAARRSGKEKVVK